ncbi:ABC transporter ATP-binding protein [Brevibacterium paucivorans]|uniref:ABC transporter ATP-binding protein n=1 Tax=Brevibacterium paucivorans TaxID=170994 RepID=A0A2N6VQ37_9MICO|nr:ABC transporter ATP-binding protein [Brevibacterium paucivorans]PMD06209.1 ABC transporter ATP-binding protein [Brevibacterium paucivorans]
MPLSAYPRFRDSATPAAPAYGVVLSHLTKTFQSSRGREVTAIRDVSLAIPAGEFVAIVGESGSGKSTLMHCAAGLTDPTSGVVTLAGTHLSSLGRTQRSRFRSRYVGFIFQDYNLVSSLTVAENVELPSRITPGLQVQVNTTEVLRSVGLDYRAQHLPHELSGGEQQRVAIARALATQPPVVFADEPTSALDLGNSELILDHLHHLSRQGTTVVMVTHDIDAATRADRAVVMAHGGTVEDISRPRREHLISCVLSAQRTPWQGP